MSLVALGLRLATVHALTGRTFAGERVFDSAIDVFDERDQSGNDPFIVAYTDDDELIPRGKELLSGEHKVTLTIHAVAAAAVKKEHGEKTIVIPQTDEGLEIILDLMQFDILREIQSFGGEWGELWRNLVVKCQKISIRRGASAQKGVRFAAREIALDVDVIADPYPGMEKLGPWADLDTLLRGNADMQNIADLIDERRQAGSDLPHAERLRATLGISRKAAGALSFRDMEGNPLVFR